MTLRLTASDLAWDAVPGSTGYTVQRNGKAVTNTRAALTAHNLALALGDLVEIVAKPSGKKQAIVVTWAALAIAPPPPPPAPGGIVVAPPIGPLAVHDGAYAADFYKFLYQWDGVLDGGEIGGLDIRNYVKYGIGLLSWNPATPSPPGKRWNVHDLKVSGIQATPLRSLNGTAEAGCFIGQASDLARIQFGPGNGWMDLWSGSVCDGSTFRDLLFQHPELVAIYLEHVSTNLLFERFIIQQGASSQSNAVNVEWTYGGFGSSRNTFRSFDIYCPKGATGLFLDAGTWGCVIADQGAKCRFWGPGNAIGLPNNLAGPTKNVVNMPNITFENEGEKVYYHDNAIGAVAGARAIQSARPLHPHTMRMPSTLKERLAALPHG